MGYRMSQASMLPWCLRGAVDAQNIQFCGIYDCLFPGLDNAQHGTFHVELALNHRSSRSTISSTAACESQIWKLFLWIPQLYAALFQLIHSCCGMMMFMKALCDCDVPSVFHLVGNHVEWHRAAALVFYMVSTSFFFSEGHCPQASSLVCSRSSKSQFCQRPFLIDLHRSPFLAIRFIVTWKLPIPSCSASRTVLSHLKVWGLLEKLVGKWLRFVALAPFQCYSHVLS